MKDVFKEQGSWSTLGLEIVLCVLLGFFGGRWIDGRFGTGPWLSVLGFFFGCGAAGKAIYRSMKHMQAVTAEEERRKGNPAPLYERPKDRETRDEGREPLAAPPADPIESSEDHDECAR